MAARTLYCGTGLGSSSGPTKHKGVSERGHSCCDGGGKPRLAPEQLAATRELHHSVLCRYGTGSRREAMLPLEPRLQRPSSGRRSRVPCAQRIQLGPGDYAGGRDDMGARPIGDGMGYNAHDRAGSSERMAGNGRGLHPGLEEARRGYRTRRHDPHSQSQT